MDPGFYKILHFIGLITLFTGLGALMTADHKKPYAMRGPAIAHGIGWILMLVSGFALQAKLHDKFEFWIIPKVVILLALGAMIGVLKRRSLPAPAAWLIVILLGAIAAYLGLTNSIWPGKTA